MRKTALALAAGVLFGVCPAQADWQYTRWGMSPAEVQAASKGQAKLNRDRMKDTDDTTAKLVAAYRSGKFRFITAFNFDRGDRLTDVRLSLTSSDCHSLIGQLTSTYGPAETDGSKRIMTLMRWRDRKNNNNVVYLGFDGDKACNLNYNALGEPNSKGGL